MGRQERFNNALKNITLSQTESGEYEIDFEGLALLAHKQVFSPKYFRSSHILLSAFPFREGERLLEVGCGLGTLSIIAALKHNNDVVATDINPYAVSLCRKNARHYKLKGRVDVRHGDVFSAIKLNETFDTVFWDPPFVWADDDYIYQSPIERAVFDPGYRQIERFIRQSHRYLNKGGRLLMNFGSNGDREKFTQLVIACGYGLKELSFTEIEDRGGLTYTLYQLFPLSVLTGE